MFPLFFRQMKGGRVQTAYWKSLFRKMRNGLIDNKLRREGTMPHCKHFALITKFGKAYKNS